MDSKVATFGKGLLTAVFVCGALPFFAFVVGKAIFGEALLVGPFLLVSPILAVMTVGMAWSLCFPWLQGPNREVPDQTLSELANRIGHELGLPHLDVYLQPDNESDYFCPVMLHGARIDVRSSQWSQLSKEERDFALAQPLAHMAVSRKPWSVHRWHVQSLLFICAVGASQSLWLIIPAQSIGAVWLLFSSLYYMKLSMLAADRRALEFTRDLRAAVSFLERRWKKSAPPWLKFEDRLAALRTSAAEIGIA